VAVLLKSVLSTAEAERQAAEEKVMATAAPRHLWAAARRIGWAAGWVWRNGSCARVPSRRSLTRSICCVRRVSKLP